MKKIYWGFGLVLAVVIGVSVFGNWSVGAEMDPLKAGTVVKRTELAGAPGLEAILVLREVPGGGESGWHTQSGNEVVYIFEGSVVLEVKGKEAQTIKTGEAFTTAVGDVHNVKNASATAPVKAAAFYIAKKGTKMEDLSVPSN